MKDEIVLAINQSANTRECGSCKFFERRDATTEYDKNGSCTLRFPPNRIFAKQVWDAESQPLDTVLDTNSCSFWESSGRTYIVSQRIKP